MAVAAQSASGSARDYRPREAERSLVHRIVARELDGFLADAAARGHPLPRFVETTMRDFLACGLFEHGFVTLQCKNCGARRAVRFRALPPPDTAEVLRVLHDTTAAMLRTLTTRGLGVDGADEDPLAKRNPVLAGIYAAALQGRAAVGEGAGQPLIRIGHEDRAHANLREEPKFRCAVLGGFSLHAGVSVSGRDRAGLERLCRYMGRPALAAHRLEELPDGRLLYRLRHRWRDGTSALVMEPRELLARLAAQVPPPGAHQVRYHGILAPGAMWRSYVVPREKGASGTDRPCNARRRSHVPSRHRIAWSELLRRVFAIDALVCPACGGRMEMKGVIQAPGRDRWPMDGGATRAPPDLHSAVVPA